MKFTQLCCATALVTLCLTSTAALARTPGHLAAAVADKARPAADVQRDADRKPAECMQFAGIKRGSQVVELVPGAGYFTRMLSSAVGRRGKIFAVVPAPRDDAPAGAPDRAAPIKALAADAHYSNVTVLVQPIKRLELRMRADVVWTSQNYHDVHNAPGIDLLAFNKSVFDALKPGGVYFIIDHAAANDAATDVTSKLHRINVNTVKQEVLAAGFVLEAQSDLLQNEADPRSLAVFDAGIRGKTDQFILKFRKPKNSD